MTLSLIGMNVVIFLLGLLAGPGAFSPEFGMWPLGIALQDDWYRLITAAFLHAGVLHLAFNMYVLWLLGPGLESALGHARFLVLYLVAALGGSVASYVFSPINTLSVGASGAIFGLMAAVLVIGRHFRQDVSQVAILLAINVGIGFVLPGIDWRAHLGGALAGAAVAAVMAYAPKASRAMWQSLGVLLIVAILVSVSMVRSAAISQLASQIPG